MSDYVVVTSTSNTITVINQPSTLVIADSAMRGPTGPQGPAGPGANDAYAQANAAYAAANSASGGGEAYNQANSAYSQANTARTTANDSYGQANTARNQANTARDQANTSRDQANTARDTANGAYSQANSAYAHANIVYAQANAAYGQANAAYADANTRVLKAGDTMTGNLNVAATIISQNIVPNLNVTYSIGTPTMRFKDLYVGGNTIYIGDTVLSATGDEMRANTFNASVSFLSAGLNVLDQANSARNQANTARDQANTARDTANGAYAQANGAYAQANVAYAHANIVYAQANTARDVANASYGQANTARNTANDAYAQANTARNTANDAYTGANTANTNALNAYSQANTARDTANSAYAAANSAGGNAKITANSGSQVSTANINFVNTSTVTVSVVSGDNGNANVSFTAVGGGSGTIAAPNTAILVANVDGAANGTNNFIFNVATNFLGVGTNTPNSNITVAGNVWVTTGINVATINITTANVTNVNGRSSLAIGTGTGSNGNVLIHANGVEVIRVTNVGRVGVFSTTPNSNVVIVGNAWITTNLTVSTNITTATFNATTANLTTTITPTLNAINANITTATIATGNVTVGNVSGNLFVGGSITTGGSNGDISNVNTIYASTFSSGGVNVTAQAAAAYGQANSAGLTAELALDQANDVYAQANTARNTGNNAYAQANAGYAQANSAYGQANDAYTQANSAYGQANSAYTAANNAANTVRVSQNSGSTLSAKQLNFVNTANVTITVTDSGDGNANIQIFSAGGGANTANVTFQNNIVVGTAVGQTDGLYLAAGSGQIANLQYLRLRGGDDDAHIHFDTANTEAYDFYIGDDSKYVKLERGIAGNIVIGTYGAGPGNWIFNSNSQLTLPGNVKNGNSAINFVANSSGDGNGYSTIELRPDSAANLDQYIIIDPTAPSHIHIRAGGQQDNSNASLFLGGENSYFRVTGGANADVTISANSHQFVYGEYGYGVMRFPLRLYAELPQSPVIITGQRAFITDANLAASGNFGAVISGGGSNSVPVWSDGTNWRIG